jgi:uncharacterized membrane protein (DUF4010 family)
VTYEAVYKVVGEFESLSLRHSGVDQDGAGKFDTEHLPRNPIEISAALEFGLFVSLIIVMARAAADLIGDRGLCARAAISGLLDVDAIARRENPRR